MAVETALRTGRRWAAGVALLALVGAGAACGGDDDATADFCEKYRAFEDENQRVADDFTDNPEDVDIEEAKQFFSDLASQVDELEGEAPDEISDDVKVLADTTRELADAIEQAEGPEELAEAFTSAAQGTEEADAAGTRVDDWVQDNCDSDGAK
jgi:methyl-accepting chemotaxis protein